MNRLYDGIATAYDGFIYDGYDGITRRGIIGYTTGFYGIVRREYHDGTTGKTATATTESTRRGITATRRENSDGIMATA